MNEELKVVLNKTLEGFSGKSVIVLGEGIVDEYVYGKPLGHSISSMAPKIEYERADYFKGGAGNVVKNLLELGANVTFVTVIGDDTFADYYKKWKHPKLKLYAIVEKNRKTIVKSRFCAGTEQLLEVERLDCNEISKGTEDNIINILENEAARNDIIILQDQGHGFFSQSLIKRIKDLNKDIKKKVLVNSQTYLKEPNHRSYAGFHTILINLKEAGLLDKSFEPQRRGESLMQMLNSDVCVTLGEEGAILFRKGQKYNAESIRVKPLDTCGAGDSFFAAFALSDFENNPEASLKMANIWAGLSTLRMGTEIPTKEELINYIKGLSN